MKQKITLHQMIPLVFLLLLVGVILLFFLNFNHPVTSSSIFNSPGNMDSAASGDAFDDKHAAEIFAMRWQAMAQFYKAQGLLTRDDFDYEQATDLMAYRWEAMARAYQRMGLLNYKTSITTGQPGVVWVWNYVKGGVVDKRIEP